MLGSCRGFGGPLKVWWKSIGGLVGRFLVGLLKVHLGLLGSIGGSSEKVKLISTTPL